MSDVYFIQIRGGDREILEQMSEQAGEWQIDDNIIIVPEEVEPLNRQQAKQYLEEMADALDMEVSESDVE